MSILGWLILGLVAGVIANAIDPRPAWGGVLGAIVLGIIGAIVGGFIGDSMFGVGVSGFNFTSLILSIVGALVVLFIGRMFTRSEI